MSRNSTLLSLLAAIAAIAGGRFYWTLSGQPARAQAAGGTGTNAAPVAVAPTENPGGTNRPALHRMALAVVQREWPRWLDRPARDPFLAVQPPRGRQAATETPVSRFRLLAIWLQTGGRLAVIDRAVYAEGDQLAEYRILRINADEVVVRGADKTEKITFTTYIPNAKVPSGSGTNLIEQWLGPEKEDLF